MSLRFTADPRPPGPQGRGPLTGCRSSTSPRARLLHSILALLDENGVPCCVLHGYEAFAHDIPSDVDCILPAAALPGRLASILAENQAMLGAVLVQCLQHEATAYYLVLALRGLGSERQFLALDVSSDYRRNGRIFYRGEELLASRRREGSVWVPSPALEFGCYLVKKVAKRSLAEAHGRRLSVLYGMVPAGCEREVARFWDPPSLNLIVEAARSGRWDAVRGCLADLRRRLIGPGSLAPCIRLSNTGAARGACDHRWRSATGVHVVLLGPRRAGRSTTSAALEEAGTGRLAGGATPSPAPALSARFSGPPATRPHALPPRECSGCR